MAAEARVYVFSVSSAERAARGLRSERLRPEAPQPPEKPLGMIRFLAALAKNPISAWDRSYFEQPIVVRNALSNRIIMVSDPEAVRRVLLDNADNYHKDPIQRRMLAPGPIAGESLFLAEDEAWRKQRRALAGLVFPSID